MARAISQSGGTLLHALIRSRAARLVLVALFVLYSALPVASNSVVKAQTTLTHIFTGSDLQTYWLPNPGFWATSLSSVFSNLGCHDTGCGSQHGWDIGTSGDLSLGFNSTVHITDIEIVYSAMMSAAQCDHGYADGYLTSFLWTTNGNTNISGPQTDDGTGCGGAPTGGFLGCGSCDYVQTAYDTAVFPDVTASGVTVHLAWGLPMVVTKIIIQYSGCDTDCYNSSGYAITGGGGAASPNSCTFGDGYLVTGQGPLFYICIAQQFILRQIEPPIASIFQELSAVTHIAYSTGVWLSAAGQGAVNWLASGVTQFAQYLNSVVSAAANGIINAILQLVIATQGTGGGGSGTCGGGQGGIFGFLLQLIGCDIIGKITDLLNTLIGGIVSLATTLINAILSFLQAVIGLILAIAGMILSFAEYLISTMLSLFTALLAALSAADAASQTTGIITTALSPTCTDPTIASPVCTLLALLDNTIFANPLIPDLFNGMIGVTVLGMLFWAAQRLSGVLEAAA